MARGTERPLTDAELLALKHDAWRDGDLTYALHGGQMEALELHNRFLRVVLEIARRYGKTRLICVIALMVCLRREGARYCYAAPTGVMVRRFALPEMRLLAQDAPPDIEVQVMDSGVVRIRREGWTKISQIELVGCEDNHMADALRGPSTDGYAVDEGGFVPVLGYVLNSVLAPQLLTTRKLWMPGDVGGHGLVASTPPPTSAHPFSYEADVAATRGAYMRRTLYDAPHLTAQEIQSYVDEIGGEASVDYRREILAERVTDPRRAIVPEWSDASVSDAESGPHIDRYVVGDLGYVDLTVILLAEWDFLAAKLRVVDEVVVERTTSGEIQSKVRAKEIERWGPAQVFKRVLDAPAITRADMIRLHRDEPEAARWQAARTDDLEAGVNALREDVRHRRVLVHSRCRVTIAHMKAGIWNERRTAFDRSAGLGHFDGVAAMLYLVRHVDRNHNPSPPEPYDYGKQFRGPLHEERKSHDREQADRWGKALLGNRRERR